MYQYKANKLYFHPKKNVKKKSPETHTNAILQRKRYDLSSFILYKIVQERIMVQEREIAEDSVIIQEYSRKKSLGGLLRIPALSAV